MEIKLLKQMLLDEGFPIVYERHDDPGFQYPRHCHQDKVTFFVTQGRVHFTFDDGTIKLVTAGQRFDVPPKAYHTALVGESGCDYVVGQMNERDA